MWVSELYSFIRPTSGSEYTNSGSEPVPRSVSATISPGRFVKVKSSVPTGNYIRSSGHVFSDIRTNTELPEHVDLRYIVTHNGWIGYLHAIRF